MNSTTYDAVVIGAGVVGCSIAYSLSRAGHRVCVVDRGPTAACGSTSASSAVVRFNYSTWAGVAASWESRQAWVAWSEHLQAPRDDNLARMITTGGLTFDLPGDNRRRRFDLFDAVGVPYQVWTAQQIMQRIPLLDARSFYPPKRIDDDEFWAEPATELNGYWNPDAGFVNDPQLATLNLMDAAVRHGADFRFRSAVTAIGSSGDRVTGVTVNDDVVLSAPIVINAAGPHSGAINRLADVLDDFHVATRPMRQEVHEVPAPPGYGDTAPGPLVADIDLGTYFRGTPSGGLLVGGTEPACDAFQWLDDPDSADLRPSQAVYDAQLYRAARRLPALQVPTRPRGIGGVYDVSDDWIPIYDRTVRDGFYVAIGTSGNQFKNAPVVGDFLAAIIDACENGHDHDLKPVQFTLPRTGHVIDLSAYSRRRMVSAEGSFGVMG